MLRQWFITASLLSVAGMQMQMAQAADAGTIGVAGTVTTSTCSATVNGGLSSAAIILPPIKLSDVPNVVGGGGGAAAASAVVAAAVGSDFTIDLTGCAGGQEVMPLLSAATDIYLNLTNVSGTATGVLLALYANYLNDGIWVKDAPDNTSVIASFAGTGLTEADTNGNKTYRYRVIYNQRGPISAGTFNAPLTYTLDYL